MKTLDEITGWTVEELAEGWRYGVWRNATTEAKGDYLRDDSGKILRFERMAGAYATLKARGLKYHIGPERPVTPPEKPVAKKRKKAAPLTLPLFEPPEAATAYVCPVPPGTPD